MSRKTAWMPAAMAAGLLLVVARGGSAQLVGVDISGTWVLNPDRSDNPRDVIRKKMQEMHGHGGQGGGPPEGGGGPGGGGWGGGAGTVMADGAAEMVTATKAVAARRMATNAAPMHNRACTRWTRRKNS